MAARPIHKIISRISAPGGFLLVGFWRRSRSPVRVFLGDLFAHFAAEFCAELRGAADNLALHGDDIFLVLFLQGVGENRCRAFFGLDGGVSKLIKFFRREIFFVNLHYDCDEIARIQADFHALQPFFPELWANVWKLRFHVRFALRQYGVNLRRQLLFQTEGRNQTPSRFVGFGVYSCSAGWRGSGRRLLLCVR